MEIKKQGNLSDRLAFAALKSMVFLTSYEASCFFSIPRLRFEVRFDLQIPEEETSTVIDFGEGNKTRVQSGKIQTAASYLPEGERNILFIHSKDGLKALSHEVAHGYHFRANASFRETYEAKRRGLQGICAMLNSTDPTLSEREKGLIASVVNCDAVETLCGEVLAEAYAQRFKKKKEELPALVLDESSIPHIKQFQQYLQVDVVDPTSLTFQRKDILPFMAHRHSKVYGLEKRFALQAIFKDLDRPDVRITHEPVAISQEFPSGNKICVEVEYPLVSKRESDQRIREHLFGDCEELTENYVTFHEKHDMMVAERLDTYSSGRPKI